MASDFTVIEKICRSYDPDKKKHILSKKDSVEALVTFRGGVSLSVYCPLLGEKVERNSVMILEHYCTADSRKKITCPYTKNN